MREQKDVAGERPGGGDMPPLRGLLLAAMTATGMLPGSLLAVMVTVGRHALGFSAPRAALLGAIDIYAAAAGTLAMALLGVPARWRRAAAAALAGLVLLDLLSMGFTDFPTLVAIRTVHGLAGGVLMGIGYAAIGRTRTPDRLFGLLLLVQFAIGGAGIALLPSLVLASGAWLFFALLAGAGALVLVLLPLIPEAPLVAVPGTRAIRHAVPRSRLLVALGALFLFEAGHTAGGAFLLELGRSHGFDLASTQRIVGLAGLSGMVGALGVSLAGTRYGRLRPILWATAAGIVSAGLVLDRSQSAFAIGTVIGSVGWAWSIPLVLGLCAMVDRTGRGAAWAGFVAKAGLASGPVMAAMLISEDSLSPAIWLSAVLAVLAAALFWQVDRTARRS